LLLSAARLSAHHSFAAEYDIDKPITLTGKITRIEWMSPHIYFYIDVKEKDGGMVNWAISGPSPAGLYRNGVRKDLLALGQSVTVQGFQARNGTKLANLRSVSATDGKVLFARLGDQAVDSSPVRGPQGYPTADVPKTADGKPNLTASAPRTPDGKPDLSGTWEMKKDRPCPPEGCADHQVVYQFFDIGHGMQNPLPYQAWAAKQVKSRMADNGKDDPTSHCQALGVVKSHTFPLPRKIVQTPSLVVILNAREAAYRQIFTDGRPLSAGADLLPSFNGYSSGKWEGDTLVVETAGFKDGLWLDRNGSPLTSAARIVERFRRLNYGNLEIEMTVNDPKAYTAPWTVTLKQVIVLNEDLVDYICLENEKDGPIISGPETAHASEASPAPDGSKHWLSTGFAGAIGAIAGGLLTLTLWRRG
jgi:hypothetical protein